MDLGQGTRVRAAAADRRERGYAMAALLVGISVMTVLMSMALPVWTRFAKREKEEELIWRGQQYARAVRLFQQKYANTFPPTIDVLVEQKFLRRKYKDPITNDDFQPIPAGGGVAPGVQTQAPGVGDRLGSAAPQTGFSGQTGAGGARPATPTPFGVPAGTGGGSIGIQGVVSKSKDTSIKMYNGRTKYNEWAFVNLATAQSVGPGAAGSGQQPGAFGPQGQQLPGRPPVPGGTDLFRPGQPPPGGTPFGQPSPFAPAQPFGAPGQPGSSGQRPPSRPPGR